MTANKFKKYLTKLIEDDGVFVVDTIDMKQLIKDARKEGFDDVIMVAGEDETEVFTMPILKIKP